MLRRKTFQESSGKPPSLIPIRSELFTPGILSGCKHGLELTEAAPLSHYCIDLVMALPALGPKMALEPFAR